MPTSKITSSVDYYIKEEYEATFDPGKVVYKEMIEEGMLRRIAEFNPIKASKLRIERLKLSLSEEEARLRELEYFELNNKLETKKQKKDSPDLEQFRINKFELKKGVLLTQYNNGSLDWTKNADIFRFKNANDFRNWVIPLLQEA